MSKITETTTETISRERTTAIICDKCGKHMPPNYDVDGDRLDRFGVNEFVLYHKTGQSYPDNGHGTMWSVEDLCGDCTRTLYTLLVQNGFCITNGEWDW